MTDTTDATNIGGRYARSVALYAEAREAIAGGVNSNFRMNM